MSDITIVQFDQAQSKDFLYSRNKWHLLCSSMGWPASTTSTAAFLDAIRAGQEENKELKAENAALRESLAKQNRLEENLLATAEKIAER